MSKNSPTDYYKLPTSLFTRLLVVVGKVIWLRKVIGKENIDTSKPAVFTCNHGRTAGPCSAVVHLPVRFRPWINACMLDVDEATDTIKKTFRNRFNFIPLKLKNRIIPHAAKGICHLLNSFGPIPVYKGMPKESAGTIELSVDALMRGENLLIFPEKPKDHYDPESYKVFNTGFAALGKALYDRAGQCLDFYPIWSDFKTHTFRIGKPVTYDPANEPHAEKVRISNELRDRMTELKDLCKK